MNKKDVLKIIVTIEEFYNHPWTKKLKKIEWQNGAIAVDATKEEILVDIVNTWHEVLKDYEFEFVSNNLKEHIKTSRFMPTIADLVKEPEKRDRAIPTHEETMLMLEKWEEERKNVASKEVREAALAEMRRILGIEREE